MALSAPQPFLVKRQSCACHLQAHQKDGRLATALTQQAAHLADANRIRHEMSDSHVQKFREETHHRCRPVTVHANNAAVAIEPCS